MNQEQHQDGPFDQKRWRSEAGRCPAQWAARLRLPGHTTDTAADMRDRYANLDYNESSSFASEGGDAMEMLPVLVVPTRYLPSDADPLQIYQHECVTKLKNRRAGLSIEQSGGLQGAKIDTYLRKQRMMKEAWKKQAAVHCYQPDVAEEEDAQPPFAMQIGLSGHGFSLARWIATGGGGESLQPQRAAGYLLAQNPQTLTAPPLQGAAPVGAS
eukprot:g9285.t1